MRENPLIELAEEFEYDADLVIDLPEAANCELRKARILRTAAAVIEAHYSHVDGRNLPASLHPDTWHMCDIKVRRNGRDEYFEGDWLKNVASALADHEDACREEGK